MSDDELMIYEFMLSMRGVPFSAKEISKAIDRKRADKDLRWAHTPLKKLVLKERIQQTNEGFYIIPLGEEAAKEKAEMAETLAFEPGDARCGGTMPELVPQMAGLDTLGLNDTETMFLKKSAAAAERARMPAKVKPAETVSEPLSWRPPLEEKPPSASPAEAPVEERPRRRTNPFDNIDFFGIPRRPPRP
ncbi:MAG: hypothetical protein HZA89_14015 [Verrucomicrobia bacterium]|nr:hypothetical protein [Verrucomicrobiota bacterium]